MTLLQIMSDDGKDVLLRTDDNERIATELAAHGIRFEQWAAAAEIADDSSQEEIMHAYRDDIDKLCAEGGFRLVDVVRMHPDLNDPQWPAKAKAAREKFLNEHTHDEDEVRFFVEGRGCFYLHIGDHVHAVVCEAGDLLSVPAGTTHWFDMGSEPAFCAIRFFEEEEGWIGSFTQSPISSRIPALDVLVGKG